MAEEEKQEGQTQEAQEKTGKKGSNPFSLRGIIDGSLLTREAVVRQLPFLFFLAALAILYIGNRNKTESMVRQSSKLQEEIKELRAESITKASELMFQSRQSEVAKLMLKNNLDLEESKEPPKKIID
jgi:hypothetical protein